MRLFFLKLMLMGSFVFIALMPVIYFNLSVDKDGFFKTTFGAQKTELNQHFIKMKMLVSGKIHKHSFIFGSSRVGNICTTRSSYTQNYYNMTYVLGVPQEHLADIKILTSKGIKIDNILVGLDNISYTVDPSSRQEEFARHAYPKTSYELLWLYLNYILSISNMRNYQQLIVKSDYPIKYDIYNSGSPMAIERDTWIECHQKEHNLDKKFKVLTQNSVSKERVKSTIQDIKELVDFCQKNNIHLIVFMNPLHETTYRSLNISAYFRFLRELSQVTNFVDFSGLNSITTNNYYYYEISHYRPVVGDMIVNRLLGTNKDESFGASVTSKNIEAHISQLSQGL